MVQPDLAKDSLKQKQIEDLTDSWIGWLVQPNSKNLKKRLDKDRIGLF